MNKQGRYLAALTAMAMCQASGLACAQQALPGLSLSIKPRLLDSRIVNQSKDKSTQAQLNSGLAVSVASRILAVDVDYGMLGVINEHSTKSEKSFSQRFDARLQSSLLNETLGVDAIVTAESLLRDGGQIYRSKVSPGFSAALTGQARLSVNYDYVLDKPSRLSAARESRGYSLTLGGSLNKGRLAWSTQYSANSEYEDRLLLTRAIEGLALKSSYQLGATLQIEVSSAFRQELRVVDNGEALSAESRHSAALSWSPTDQYSLGFKLQSRDQSDQQHWQTSGSGTFRWLPHPDLQFTLDYGDQLIEGSAGWMLHTRLNISG